MFLLVLGLGKNDAQFPGFNAKKRCFSEQEKDINRTHIFLK